MKGLLRIGDLARLGGVSIKALRYYDEQGLLRPDHVDPKTGYRYYSADQARDLAEITNLRCIDFSIQEITALLDTPPEKKDIAAAIDAKKREIGVMQADLDEKLKIADLIASLNSDENFDSFSPLRLSKLSDQIVYSVNRTVHTLGEEITDIFETSETIVAASHARASAPPFLIFHDPPTRERDLKIEVCIPVDGHIDDLAAIKKFQGGGYGLSAVYQGGYKKTNNLYQQMKVAAEHAGLRINAPLREIYHRFGADQEEYRLPAAMLAKGSAEYLTELLLPISLPDPKEKT